MVADDFHGPWQWDVFAEAMTRVFPDRPIVDIPDGHEILHVLYDLDERTQIPGRRMIREVGGGRIEIYPEGSPPTWRGIYDEKRPAHGRHELQHGHGRRLGARGRSRVPGADDRAGVPVRNQLRDLRDDALGWRAPTFTEAFQMFDPKQLLDQVLGANAGGGLRGVGNQVKGRLDSMSGSGGFASGAAVGGVLGLLLGGKKMQRQRAPRATAALQPSVRWPCTRTRPTSVGSRFRARCR